ncbi:MAG: hypothetical protein AUJ71_02355 [Candidatus Omnitrophica bacterium CG1_02_49_16]|nr:MAG: hypothetical protein AUJ71_02355 [Candidatus Omnitrophica bacterium CG1_02_49_16]
MIKITLLTGRFAGQTRTMPTELSPADVFAAFVKHSDEWRVDYSVATEEEQSSWLLAEIVARIVRALQQGRVVKFLDREFRLEQGDDLLSIGKTIEDIVVAQSGRTILVYSDDEKGLVIGEVGYEM